MSASTLYNKWKESINKASSRVVAPVSPWASRHHDEFRNICDEALEQHTFTRPKKTDSTQQLNLMLGKAMAANLEATILGGIQGLLPMHTVPQKTALPVTPSQHLLGTFPTQLVVAPSQKHNIPVPANDLTQLLKNPPHKQGTCSGPYTLPLDHTAITAPVHVPTKLADEAIQIMVGDPSSSDILFGQIPAFNDHPGNVKVRQILEAYVGYLPMSADHKTNLCLCILREAIQNGARFLTRQESTPNGIWYRIDEGEAQALLMRWLEAEVSKKSAVLIRDRMTALSALGLSSSVAVSAPVINLQKLDHEEPQQQQSAGSLRQNHLRQQAEEQFAKLLQGQPPLVQRSEAVTTSQNPFLPRPTGMSHSVGIVPAEKTEGNEVLSDFVVDVDDFEAPLKRKSRDTSLSSSSPPTGSDKVPMYAVGPNDVVCGTRGTRNLRYPCNQRMFAMLESAKGLLSLGTWKEMTSLARVIVDNVYSSGGRFLTRVDGAFELLDDEKALLKVAKGFHSVTRPPRKSGWLAVACDVDLEQGPAFIPGNRSLQSLSSAGLPSATNPDTQSADRATVEGGHKKLPKPTKRTSWTIFDKKTTPVDRADPKAAGEMIVDEPCDADILFGCDLGHNVRIGLALVCEPRLPIPLGLV